MQFFVNKTYKSEVAAEMSGSFDMKLDFPVYVIFYEYYINGQMKYIKVLYDFVDEMPYIWEQENRELAHCNADEWWDKEPFRSDIVNTAKAHIGMDFVEGIIGSDGDDITRLRITREWIYRRGVEFNIQYNNSGFDWDSIPEIAQCLRRFYPSGDSITGGFDLFAKNKFFYKERMPALTGVPMMTFSEVAEKHPNRSFMRAYEYLQDKSLVPIRLVFDAPSGDKAELNICVER